MVKEILYSTRIGNKEMASATRELVRVGRETIYKLTEIGLTGRDFDLLSSKIEPLAQLDKLKLKYFQERENNFGALTPVLKDKKLDYVFVEGPGLPVSVAFDGKGILKTNITYGTEALAKQVLNVADKTGATEDMLTFNKKIENMVVTAINGSVLGIRLLDSSSAPKKHVYPKISREALAYLLLALSKNLNIVIVGSKGSGKTDLAWTLARFVKGNIVTIEDYPKIILKSEKWMPFVKPRSYSPGKLLIEVSRMKPEYVMFDELRGREISVLFNKRLGLNSISTLTLDNFEMLVDTLTGTGFNAPKSAISNADIIVHIGFAKLGNKRTSIVREIIEITGFNIYKNKISISTVFRWDGKRLRAFQSAIPLPSKEKLRHLLLIAQKVLT